ncbi:hypothetical protein TIFTF001_042936 [Ficus carica]|uniref:Uncharacterized protein n=1 Tax=Ficus carica TaxID=3494 RepID=A0AA87YVQ9_FICCA|nr:hypothetical protein TIFTF001_042936 [Ficus carica]
MKLGDEILPAHGRDIPMHLDGHPPMPCVLFEVRVGSWFELDWAGRPNHSMAMRHVVLAERKLTTYVYAVGKLPSSNT